LTMGYQVRLTDQAKDFIADRGFDSNFGARPLNRAIQKYLEDPIAEEILKGELQEGDTLEVGVHPETSEIEVRIAKPEKPKRKKKEEDENPAS
jgi:ATP-dependent Clp protease ATP-binding subunit ClpC